ncbi:peroxidase [Thermoplasmatales archaeon SW_10_69_26]|nr:MAG: peroxidase [Thermoplasmatales archaeon SW_10_69_26]
MAFIDVIEPDEAEPSSELAAFYERVGAERGNVANVHRVASLHPPLAASHLDLYMSLMYDREAGLDRRRREMIAVAVSRANDCGYCVTHHSEALSKYEDDEALVETLGREPTAADLDPADRALVDFALRLTDEPGAMASTHAEELREHGFDDEDILAAAAVTSYFNFVNRLNLGLGAELEDDEDREYDH